MSFLAPLFFLGLAAIAVPVFVHLIQRERKRVVEFPSLMFLQRIPYQSVRRRRIRHWFLLLMRAAAIALLVGAFARPFLPQSAAAVLAAGGDREVVILLDRSASMGYGDHWARARDHAVEAVRALGANDRATLIVFDQDAEEHVRSTADRGRLEAALQAASVSSGATRFSPALKLAESILVGSNLPRKEAILISDFQRSGWSSAESMQFGEAITLTPVVVGSKNPSNLSVPSVTHARAIVSGQERVTVTAGVSNRGPEPAAGVAVALEIDGHVVETQSVTIAANAAASVAFAPFTLAGPAVRGVVRAGSDALAADNAFYFVLAPSRPVSVLIIESGDRESSFYLTRALGIGNAPTFQVEIVPAGRVTPAMIENRTVVVLNNAPVPPAVGTAGFKRFVERGGGLLVAFGDRSAWPTAETDLLPGRMGTVVDRLEGRGGTMTLDYSHPAFEVFRAPRSGDFSAAKVQRYRLLETGPDDRVLARYDDARVAAAEKRVGAGRVVAWTTTLDDEWNDFARRPIYLPLVHQIVKYLARYEQETAWRSVGQVVDLSNALKGRAERAILTPSGQRIRVGESEPGLLEIDEQGIYEIRTGSGPAASTDRVAGNLDPGESDLSAIDPAELVGAVTGRAAASAAAAPAVPAHMTAQEAERRQAIWWYMLVAGVLLLAAEMVISNRLSQNERFL